MFQYYGPTKETVAEALKPIVKTKENEEPSLGQLNPLIHYPDLLNPNRVNALSKVIRQRITQHGGIQPVMLESKLAVNKETPNAKALRYVAKFELPQFSEQQFDLLEQLAKDTYGISVKTSRDSKGRPIRASFYPDTEEEQTSDGFNIVQGWYLGPNTAKLDTLHQGIYVFQDQGTLSRSNFTSGHNQDPKFIVEVREADNYQTDIARLVTQVASILSHERTLNPSDLLYNLYYDLIRLGLSKYSGMELYGMDAIKERIDRGLYLPLANPGFSRSIGLTAESALLVGYMGTGKTQLAVKKINEDTGIFTCPLDANELVEEFKRKPAEREIFPRIFNVQRETGRPVILHVDDIERVFAEGQDSNSTALNVMAGVTESGFNMLASTNYPEQVAQQLMQAQRFGIIEHCPLPPDAALYDILSIHTPMYSGGKNYPLFHSPQARERILRETAARALKKAFTGRYLREIANQAQSLLLERISKEQGKSSGLTEDDLDGYFIRAEEFDQAFGIVAAGYDTQGVIARNHQLADFVKKQKDAMGYPTAHQNEQSRHFSDAFYREIASIENQSE